MTAHKWSMLILVSIALLAVGPVGCGGQPAAAPASASAPQSSPQLSPLPSPSTASSPSDLTVVSIVVGKVLLMRVGETTWAAVSVGTTLEPGDRIKTGAGSNAVITFFEGSTIELEAGTEIAVNELNIAEGTGSTTIKLWQHIGKTRSRVEKLVDPASRYEVETPAGAAVVRGSVGVTEVDEVGNMWLYVEEGEWWLCAQGECLKLGSGEGGSVMVGQPPSRGLRGRPPPTPPAPPGGMGVGPPSTGLVRFWTQTTVSHFSAGTADNVTVVDVGGGDGTVALSYDPLAVCFADQDNRNYSANMTHSVYGMQYQAQTFRAGKTGNICEVALYLEKVGRPLQPLIVELWNCVATGQGIEPGNIVHTSVATGKISGAAEYLLLFSAPYTVVAGTDYSLVLHQQGNGGNATNCYKWYEAVNNPYPNGMVWQSSASGASWQEGSYGQHDFYFATSVSGHYLSGTLESRSHDCGGGADFVAIIWNSAVPAGAELKFQIATNNDNSAWNFVGPSGASNTYYTTSGTPIWSGHDGDRYIKYKAYLQTADPSQTPELKQVWITYR